MGPVHSSFVGSFRRKYQFDTVSERQCRKGEEMQLFYLQVNVNKQFNILNLSTRTIERFEQSWTALRRFKTDMCGAAIQYLGAEGATFVKFLLLIIWLQPSSLTASARHRLSVQASATEQIAEIERGRMVTRSPGPSPAYMGKYSLAQLPSRV